MRLDQNWKLHSFKVGEFNDLEVASPDFIDNYWMTAEVPGDVHSTLIKRRLIENPYYGHNDLKCQWVEEKVWWYRTSFDFQEVLQEEDRIELIFEGLDTFATIYLNGLEIGSTENMFVEHIFDVTREIVQGKNILAVKFEPVSQHVKNKLVNYWSGFSKERIWTRKAQYHFGWDWGPRLVSVGICGDVRLEKKTAAKIDNIFVYTTHLEKDQAEIKTEVNITRFVRDKDYEIEVAIIGENPVISKRMVLMGDRSNLSIRINNPKLWWTHDLGEPYLYKVSVTLFANGIPVDVLESEFGIRTLTVERVNEEGRPSFTFVLNGVKLFAKGANWIPVDSLVGLVTKERYVNLLSLAREANMNMLRVWGGGIYENNVFYQTCNRLGILVWQDFMFACALYPDYNKNFMDNVKREITEVVKRLRNHPCLAIWCGNNENDWLYEALYSSGEIHQPFYGEKIYHQMIPDILEALDPSRFYWPSSPYGGNDHNSREEGDTHNWQVWHGNVEPRHFGEPQRVDYSVKGISFKNFKKDTSLFVSEFGMHASANKYTLKRNIPENQLYWGSEEMAYRNKDVHHQKGILLMAGYTDVPETLDQYIAFSMLTQAEGLKYGVEHYRRRKSFTSGSLIWQLNDCWPGTSWSLIDYYMLPKAAYYYAKKFFHPILLTIDHDPGQPLCLWIVNDKLTEYHDTINLEAFHFNGDKIFSRTWNVHIPGNQNQFIDALTEQEILSGRDAREIVVVIRSVYGNIHIPPNFYYLRDQKDLHLPIAKLEVTVNKNEQTVSIKTDVFARMVTIELDSDCLYMDDNFFDLLPNEMKTVKIRHLEGKTIPWDTLTVTSLSSLLNISNR